MNRKKEPYDYLAVGIRIHNRRNAMGMSQDELAELIDRAPKYCSDIERGVCGMSIQTMIALSRHLGMSLDYLIFGHSKHEALSSQSFEEDVVLQLLSRCGKTQRENAVKMLRLFLSSTNAANNTEHLKEK